MVIIPKAYHTQNNWKNKDEHETYMQKEPYQQQIHCALPEKLHFFICNINMYYKKRQSLQDSKQSLAVKVKHDTNT